MDMKALMDMAQNLKGQLDEAQQKASDHTYVGEAGGGMVKVVMNGKSQVTQVTIEPSVVDPQEVSLLEDLVRAAVNQAAQNMASGLQKNLGSMAHSMGLDLSSLGLTDESDK
jgi:nucleoid-associated protein EbfC